MIYPHKDMLDTFSVEMEQELESHIKDLVYARFAQARTSKYLIVSEHYGKLLDNMFWRNVKFTANPFGKLADKHKTKLVFQTCAGTLDVIVIDVDEPTIIVG